MIVINSKIILMAGCVWVIWNGRV